MGLILLILLLLIIFGGVGWRGGYFGPAPVGYGNPIGIILVVVVLLILFSALSPWPFRHPWY